MKTIKHIDLHDEYAQLVEGEPSFPGVYEAHGHHTECNWGGLVLTLDNSGDACIVVRDWGGDDLHISEIREIEYLYDKEEDDEDEQYKPGFYLDDGDDEPHFLDLFMRIQDYEV